MSIEIGALSRWAGLAAVATALGAAPPSFAADPAPSGPSFDCARAPGSVETAICANPGLAARDREMAQLFGLVRADALGVGASNELAVQRKWLAQRQKDCAAKVPVTDRVACIQAADDERLVELAVAALIRAPDPALTELRKHLQGPLYEAIYDMATMPDGPARTNAVAALIGPEFARLQADQAAMLDPIKTPRDAAATPKAFATFIDLTGAVDHTPVTLSCEAIVRQPALIGALDPMFGSSMDNALGGSDCDDMLPPPPRFAGLAADALTAATSDPDCTGTIRYAGMRSYSAFLIAVQLDREGPQGWPEPGAAKASAAYQRRHAAAMAAAATDLAAYYTAELHVAVPATIAKKAVVDIVDAAFGVCS